MATISRHEFPDECLFSAAELPPGKPIRFTVTPRDCFGLAGKPLSATFFNNTVV